MNTVIFEIIRIIAFSLSGTMVALKNKMDVLGAVILANITAFGGGVLRDIIIDNIPPKLFVDDLYLIYLIVATSCSALLMIAVAAFKPFKNGVKSDAFNVALNVMDAVGLAPFVLVGIKLAMEKGGFGVLMLAIIGCISGCCGGIFRDVLAHHIPIVFRKYIYIIPCFLGALAYVLLETYTSLNDTVAMIVGFTIIIGGRLAGIFFRINVPSVRIEDDPPFDKNGGAEK